MNLSRILNLVVPSLILLWLYRGYKCRDSLEPEVYAESQTIKARLEVAKKRNNASYKIAAFYHAWISRRKYVNWRNSLVVVQTVVRRRQAIVLRAKLEQQEYEQMCELFTKGCAMLKYFGPAGKEREADHVQLCLADRA